MGEGDDMIFVDDEAKPIIVGTGSEDYFCGAWNFGGREGETAFAHLYNGAQLISLPEKTGGRYCLYRWHADNPVTFNRYLRHTMEHGHATTARITSIRRVTGIRPSHTPTSRRWRQSLSACPE
jgi:hypothetical protein